MASKLRIAASAFFSLLTVVLCVLWARSNSWRDIYRGPYVGEQVLMFGSLHGHISVALASPYQVWLLGPRRQSDAALSYRSGLPSHFSASKQDLVFPHWAIALPMMIAPTAPWFGSIWSMRSRQFSLRTLLIATTFVAVALGLVAWVSR